MACQVGVVRERYEEMELVTEYLRHLRTVAALTREASLADPLAIVADARMGGRRSAFSSGHPPRAE